MIGNFGDAEVYSFHATKILNTFEGGAIVTNDDELAEKARLMNNFGFVDLDDVKYLGTNGKMSEIAGAMGLTLLEGLDEFIATNYQNYQRYREGLAGVPGLRLLEYDERERCNYQYVVVEVDERVAGVTRDELMEGLWRENVRARRYFYPGCHRMEPYRSHFPHAGLVLPHTERIAGRVLVLPTGTAVDPEQVGEICALVRHLVEAAAEAPPETAAAMLG